MKPIVIVVCLVFFLCNAAGAAEKLSLDFQDDRSVTTMGNLTHVESSSKYAGKQIDELRAELEVVKKNVAVLKEFADQNPQGKGAENVSSAEPAAVNDAVGREAFRSLEGRVAALEERVEQVESLRERISEEVKSSVVAPIELRLKVLEEHIATMQTVPTEEPQS